MTGFFITAIICAIVGTNNLINKKQETRQYKASHRGSRAVELDEWDNWSTALLREYNELTGLNIPYPEIKFFTADAFTSAYYYAFGGPYVSGVENKWKDASAIETIRIRHNLPSDDELYVMEEWMYSKKIIDRPTHYTSLAYVIDKCVQRAVNKRGFKYGGTDWEGQEATRLKWKEIESKHVWLKNDPTDSNTSYL